MRPAVCLPEKPLTADSHSRGRHAPLRSEPASSADEALLYFGAGLGTLCLACLLIVYLPWFANGYGDFLQLYTGASLLGTEELYSPEANLRIHARVGYSMGGTYYTRLPAYALLWLPLAALPYPAAYWCFQAVSVLAAGLAIRLLGPRSWQMACACALFLPLTAGFAVAQDISIVVALCAAFIAAARKRRDTLAGLLLAACAIKFHLFMLVPFALVRFRRWRMIAAAAAGIAAWIVASTAVAGAGWPRAYLSMILNPAITPEPEKMPNLHGAMASLGAPLWLEASLACGVVVLTLCVIRRTTDFTAAVGLALAGGLLLSVHAYVYDCAILLPLLTVAQARPYARSLTLFLLTPAPYVLLLTGPRLVLPLALAALIGALAAPARESLPQRSSGCSVPV